MIYIETSETELDKVQEFNDKVKALCDRLGVTCIDKEFKENINLDGEKGSIVGSNVYVIKVKTEEGELSHIVIDSDANEVARISKDGIIELSESQKKYWEPMIGTPENQTKQQKDFYNFQEEHYLDEYKINEQELENTKTLDKKEKEEIKKEKEEPQKQETKEDKEKNAIAKALDVEENLIIYAVKIEAKEEFERAINKKLTGDCYIVKFGNNKTKIMQGSLYGKMQEVSGTESSEISTEILDQLNKDKPGKSKKIMAGDVTTFRIGEENVVVVKENNPKTGTAVSCGLDNKVKVYTFDDEGKDEWHEIKASVQHEISEKELKELEDKKRLEKEEEEKAKKDLEEQEAKKGKERDIGEEAFERRFRHM